MDARSSDDALPSTPPNPASAHLPSQLPSPTRSQKQAEIKQVLASLSERFLKIFRSFLEVAFSALKLQNDDLDSSSQHMITLCQHTIGLGFRAIVNGLFALGPDSLPDWLARRILITPSQDQRFIIPDDELFQVYRTWCTSKEHFDFYSALTQLLISGLEAVSDRSTSEGKTFFDDTLISEVDDHLYDEPA